MRVLLKYGVMTAGFFVVAMTAMVTSFGKPVLAGGCNQGPCTYYGNGGSESGTCGSGSQCGYCTASGEDPQQQTACSS